jgi:excisionase family DNA binding protein
MVEAILPEGWLTTGEAETLTGYAQAYLRRLAERKRIVARKVGRDWLLNQESLRAYRDEMAALGGQRHNPWRKELAASGLGRRMIRTEPEVAA